MKKNIYIYMYKKLKFLLNFIYSYVNLKMSIKRNYILYSKDRTLKFFGLESHPFSFEVMSTNEFFWILQNLACKADSVLRNL